jgi:hypothetical protein
VRAFAGLGFCVGGGCGIIAGLIAEHKKLRKDARNNYGGGYIHYVTRA